MTRKPIDVTCQSIAYDPLSDPLCRSALLALFCELILLHATDVRIWIKLCCLQLRFLCFLLPPLPFLQHLWRRPDEQRIVSCKDANNLYSSGKVTSPDVLCGSFSQCLGKP